jgi:CRISPR-associated endonuclease/helicase Cas3
MYQLLKVGNQPFVLPDKAYDPELGLDLARVKEENLDVNYQII